MRKAQKTVKRQIKINEKKEIKFIEKPTESELDALSLKTLLLSLEIVINNHQKVWKNEEDGYLNPYYKILIGRCKNLTSDIYNKCYDDVKEQDIEYEDNFYTRQVMTAHVKDCANSIWEKAPLSFEDKLQRLPAGFTDTIHSWNGLIKNFKLDRVKKIISEFDIKEEVQELIKSSEKYLDMVDREIMKIKTA
ncbi:hypothetical protein [Fusobacterium polymorphum]|uniref:hypothetical protein n=1 Tax=Fusobacterium nucleatum subsp. polymorphum TaxID=76857 RepID=UPI00300ACFB6